MPRLAAALSAVASLLLALSAADVAAEPSEAATGAGAGAGAGTGAGASSGAGTGKRADTGTDKGTGMGTDTLAAASTATSARDPGFSSALVLPSPRIPPAPPDSDVIVFSMHGEYQLRFRTLSDIRLTAPEDRPELGRLGQRSYLYQWMRLSPRLQWKDSVAIVGQIDVPRGLVVGGTTALVDRARDALREERWYEVHPRYLYIEWTSAAGVLRVGQQGSHWGVGILANDGDHRSLFGDYQRGALAERVFFATQPFGRGSPLTVAAAGDLIFEDNTADLIDEGDRALQAVLAVMWRTKRAELGVYGVFRGQSREQTSTGAQTPFTEETRVGVLDVTAKVNDRVPGARAYVYGEMEAAAIVGSTTYLRGAYDAGADPKAPAPLEAEAIRSFGAAVTAGVVRVKGRGRSQFGSLVVEVSWGYASGDADPYDGVSSRFVFDPNHNVGLVLFDQVLAWKTARAATLAGSPGLVRRPAPGLQFLPTNGGVAGATYLNPKVVVRPMAWLDFKGGAVIAQTTADFVDPYHAGVLGSYANYDGGDERSHDLGLELDLGVDARLDVSDLMTVELGAEGGVLFPGRAFDDGRGRGLGTSYLGNVKLGVHF